MTNDFNSAAAAELMGQINQAWLDGRIDDMAPLIHPDIVMVTPGFSGRIKGRGEFLAGFRDFSQQATVHDFQALDMQVDQIGATAVVSFRYEMLYDYAGEGYQATGRDLWLFQKQGDSWLAIWRTMLDVEESAA